MHKRFKQNLIKDLEIQTEIIKYIEENIESSLHYSKLQDFVFNDLIQLSCVQEQK